MTKHTEEAQAVVDSSPDGKPRFRRERRKLLRVVPETVDGVERFKIAGLYI